MTGRLRASPFEPRFAAFLAAQALGSINDNAFKIFVAVLAMMTDPEHGTRYIALASAVYVVPFLLLSTVAGDAADRWPKARLLRLFKAAEFVLLLLAIPALTHRHMPGLLAVVFLLGVHSAFIGPVKLAMVPELVEDVELSHANGLMQAASFAAIVLGTAAAAELARRYGGAPGWAAAPMAVVALAGWLCSLAVPETPAARPDAKLEWNVLGRSLSNLSFLHRMPNLEAATVASAWFWFVGALFQMNLLVYATRLMGLPEAEGAKLNVMLALGIGLGSFIAGRLSRGRIELGLVPLGGIGLAAFGFDLAFSYRVPAHVAADLFMAGMSAGFFAVPLQAFVQQRSPASQRGRVVATGNLLSFAGLLVASGVLTALDAKFHLHPGQVFLVVTAMSLVVAFELLRRLPDVFIRLLLLPITRLFYSVRSVGLENVPLEGPVLLVANHVSFIDAFLIAMANQRMVRFLMLRSYYELPVANWLFRAMGCIPVSSNDGPKALIASFKKAREYMEAGEAVCIFAEGEISRHGQMQRFKKGFELIVHGGKTPIVPVHLDEVWGSVFSFSEGKTLFKWPRKIPYKVTVSFGKAMSPAASAFEVRQAILELGAEAFRYRLEDVAPLPLEFARKVKAHPFRFCLGDSTGARLNGLSALTGAQLLGCALHKEAGPAPNVGLFLPPSVGGALANIGLSLMGRVPVNLNYSASKEVVDACVQKAAIETVVTSKRFTEKLGWAPAGRLIYLEDVSAGISPASKAWAAAVNLLLPCWVLERTAFSLARGPLDRLATIMFTSGSTGVPKGVMLTHENLFANILAAQQVLPLTHEDVMIGVLPLFHSFGITATLWLPACLGMGAAFHYSPLDSKRVGELTEEFGGTCIVGTPTFLTAWMRRVTPEQFKSLRYVVAGAEKLRDEVGKAFEEKYGAVILEGYGCTELAPLASLNIPDIAWPGIKQTGTKKGSVGQPVPGVVMKVVDPDSGKELPADQPGLLLVKGLNVMKGYLGDAKKTAEVIKDGWYVTGDIARIDEDGFVTLTDRLSRFSKIGGEMVPHIRVEEKLHELVNSAEQLFVVAAVPDASRGERLVVLHKDGPNIDELLAKLKTSDLPKLWMPDKAAFHKVEEFPLLGSGKLDFQKLKAQARALEGVA